MRPAKRKEVDQVVVEKQLDDEPRVIDVSSESAHVVERQDRHHVLGETVRDVVPGVEHPEAVLPRPVVESTDVLVELDRTSAASKAVLGHRAPEATEAGRYVVTTDQLVDQSRSALTGEELLDNVQDRAERLPVFRAQRPVTGRSTRAARPDPTSVSSPPSAARGPSAG